MDQIYCFLIFIVVGVIISVLFDIFRILRKVFSTPDFITYIEDIIFGIISGIIIIYSIFKFNNGEIRSYIFIGIAIGILMYLVTLSKFFIRYGNKTLLFLKNILLFPVKKVIFYLKKITRFFNKKLIRPFSNFFLNIKKLIPKFSVKKCKIRRKKEGF